MCLGSTLDVPDTVQASPILAGAFTRPRRFVILSNRMNYRCDAMVNFVARCDSSSFSVG